VGNDPNTTWLDDRIGDFMQDLETLLEGYGLEHYADALVDLLEGVGAFGEDS
jgi:hypothetical protein